LSRMSYKALWKGSEGINRIALSERPNIGLLGSEIGHINGQRKQVFDGVNHANILKDVHGKIGRDFNHYINVAVRAIIAPRSRAEQRGVTYPALAQSAFVLLEPIKNSLSIHGQTYTTKGGRFHGRIELSY